MVSLTVSLGWYDYSNLYCKRVSDGEDGWTGPRAVYDLDCGAGPRTVYRCPYVSPLSVVFLGVTPVST